MTVSAGAKKKKFDREGFIYFLFIVPVIAYILLFKYKPLTGWYYAFTNYKVGMKSEAVTYVGLKNFANLFINEAYMKQVMQVVLNTLIMAFMSIFLSSPLTVTFAICLNEMNSSRARKLVQTITTLPHFISVVTLYSVVYFMLSNSGFVNTLLLNWGKIDTPINFLATPDHTYLKMWLYGVWKNLGWNAIVYIAAIAGIDQELYEAAMIDGAGRLQRILHITVPGIIPTFFVLLVINIGNLLNTGYEMQYVFQNSMNLKYIQTIDLYVYNQGISEGNIPFATAVGMLKSVIALVLFTTANTLSKTIRGSSVF
ncbi:MAG: sugar ABC transporter permease [Clostridia bacterium]|nr:sugar ABC transporter permease [Clostridia bacterium]